jgi:diacylglycerol kinase (ATP)
VRALVVWNPSAGSGRAEAILASVVERLTRAGLEVATHRTTSLDDARVTAGANARLYDAVLALGGDGTAGACAWGLAEAAAGGQTAPPGAPPDAAGRASAAPDTPGTQLAALGIIPAGSGNDAAAALGLPIRDPVAAAGMVPTLPRRPIDLVRAEVDGAPAPRWWLCVAGSGFDAEVNRFANRLPLRGRARYVSAVLALIGRSTPARFTLELDGTPIETDAWLVATANAPGYGGGMKVAPTARMDDGLLDLVVIGGLSRQAFLRAFPGVFAGTHVTHPAVTVHQAARATLRASRPTWMYADGEPVGLLPVTCTVVPGAIDALAAPGAPGLSPA